MPEIKLDQSNTTQSSKSDSTPGKEMIQALLAKHVSKQNLCQQVGFSISTLNRVLSGQIKQLRRQHFCRLLGFYAKFCLKENLTQGNIQIKE